MTAVDDVANWEIFVWALSQLDGAHRMVDVEEVFVRCFEVAPLRFSWRTGEDLPDYKKCSKALRDAEARRPASSRRPATGLVVDSQWQARNG